MQLVWSPPIVRDEQETDRDLRDEQRLDERERVPERPADVPAPEVREPAPHCGDGGGDEDGEANELMSVGHGRPMYRVAPWSRRAARHRISS
ncbi:MAG: hypothetical protein K0S82_1569 [Gaiellaceae bacterium]|nr:hypothetical protein [Gaiellaceae bacterium]